MSDNFLRIIPQTPDALPDEDATQSALILLAAMIPDRESLHFKSFPEIQFVDQGGNFERVLCPACKRDVTEDWPDWFDESAKSHFARRIVRTMCCGAESDLNDLVFEWPAGFSRQVLEVMNPNPATWLLESEQKRIESAWGIQVRQILAHY